MSDDIRFRALADAYGADLARWPLADRPAAERFIKARPELAEAILDDARVLDRVLDQGAPHRVDPALLDAILEQAEARSAAMNPASRPPRWAGLAAALALMVGLGAGWLAAPGGVDQSQEAVFAEAFAALDDNNALAEVMLEEAR